jgi:excisionase family DNA binding protein
MKKALYAHEESSKESNDDTAHSQGSSLTSKLLISVPEAAKLLGVSERTLFLLLASGDLTRRKVRRRTMIHRDDVIRFAARDSAYPSAPRD